MGRSRIILAGLVVIALCVGALTAASYVTRAYNHKGVFRYDGAEYSIVTSVHPGFWHHYAARYVPDTLRALLRDDDDTHRMYEKGELIIRSTWDVYINENRLIYVKDPCSRDDTDLPFFLHVVPVDVNNLPEHRKQHGFENRDFQFKAPGIDVQSGKKCIAMRLIPMYDIAQIRTGQVAAYMPGADRLWEGKFYAEGYMDKVIEVAGQPIIRSAWDVYINENRLTYVRDSCGRDDTAPHFFLQVVPVDVNNLSEHRRQHGFGDYEFQFEGHGRTESGGKCLALRHLPTYDISQIRTGQYIRGEGRLWEGNFDFDR